MGGLSLAQGDVRGSNADPVKPCKVSPTALLMSELLVLARIVGFSWR